MSPPNEDRPKPKPQPPLKVGDVVRLKSGGPQMVIEFIKQPLKSDEDDRVHTVWIDHVQNKRRPIVLRDSFPLKALRLTPGGDR